MLAASFERIHRSNLIGMGILPLRWPAGVNPATLAIQPGDKVEVNAPLDTLVPRCSIDVKIVRVDASVESYELTAAVETQLEVALLRCGGVIPLILQKTLAAQDKKETHER